MLLNKYSSKQTLVSKLLFVWKQTNIRSIISNEYSNIRFSPNFYYNLLLIRYESEQPFATLQLGVKHKNLDESLKEFIKGDLLEGDNAYNCEKCNKKVSIKHACICISDCRIISQTKHRERH